MRSNYWIKERGRIARDVRNKRPDRFGNMPDLELNALIDAVVAYGARHDIYGPKSHGRFPRRVLMEWGSIDALEADPDAMSILRDLSAPGPFKMDRLDELALLRNQPRSNG